MPRDDGPPLERYVRGASGKSRPDLSTTGRTVYARRLRTNDALNRGRSYATARGLADDTGKFERSRERLYVGLSRARDQLVVCGDPDFIREVGAPDLARRLSLPPEHPDPETISR